MAKKKPKGQRRTVNRAECSARSTHKRALQLIERGELFAAEKLLRQSLARDPRDPEIPNLLAFVASRAGDLEGAYRSMSRAVRLSPGSPVFQKNLGLSLRALGRTQEAEDAFRRATQLNPADRPAHAELAVVLHETGRHEQARVHLETVVKLDPNEPSGHCKLGIGLLALGEADAAIASFEAAVRLDPRAGSHYHGLGCAFELRGDAPKALSAYLSALTLDRTNADVWLALARVVPRVRFTSVDDGLINSLLVLLEQPTSHPQSLSAAMWSALQTLPVVKTSLIDPDGPASTSAQRLSKVPLLLRILQLAPVSVAELEPPFARLRAGLLSAACAGDTLDEGLPFVIALGHQGFVNEYILPEEESETKAIDHLACAIEARVLEAGGPPPAWVALISAYRPLASMTWAARLAEGSDSSPLDELLETQVRAVHKEFELREQLRRLTPVTDQTSRLVQAQYEANPYPRWTKLAKPLRSGPLTDHLRQRIGIQVEGVPSNPEILIAGTGTGHQALSVAASIPEARILAVDLSASSLAYAQRATLALGFENIHYALADILELGALERTFDVIESVGVLHHLGNPLEGWRVLVERLRPGGLMKIALYSERARKAVVEARALIREHGYEPTVEDIRRLRQDIFGRQELEHLRCLEGFWDFFSTSECRDLLFHVQEHRFTIPQLRSALHTLHLELLGFERPEGSPPRASPLGADFASIERFEDENPEAFRGMYTFWCRKPSRTPAALESPA